MDSSILGLWAPVVAFAHIFAFFWFMKTYLLEDPRALAVLKRRGRRSKQDKLDVSLSLTAREPSVVADLEADEPVVLTLDKTPAHAGDTGKGADQGEHPFKAFERYYIAN